MGWGGLITSLGSNVHVNLYTGSYASDVFFKYIYIYICVCSFKCLLPYELVIASTFTKTMPGCHDQKNLPTRLLARVYETTGHCWLPSGNQAWLAGTFPYL